ncbi:MAG: hypothetical protein GY859_14400, partial [Desulfobacterales bacterium]|nr:hypothetical protein [Desulfobacterales bacterium]
MSPILIAISPKNIRCYSSSRLPAADDEDANQNERLIKSFQRTSDALEILSFVRSVELGSVFNEKLYAKSFKATEKIDRYLLNNLNQAR